MSLCIQRVPLSVILPLRDHHLEAVDFPIRYHACHERGWTDSYLISQDDAPIGYGSVKGAHQPGDRDALFEFYLLPSLRHRAGEVFTELLRASKAWYIEAQSNDPLLAPLLHLFARELYSDTLLFRDSATTAYRYADVRFRPRSERDLLFEHQREPGGAYVLEQQGEILATGGFTLYYNPPFADLYLEVAGAHRRKGLGSYLIQELKAECYRLGRVPTARCAIDNLASAAALLKAGMAVAGQVWLGQLR